MAPAEPKYRLADHGAVEERGTQRTASIMRWWEGGFKDLVPVIPFGAEIDERSGLDLVKAVGKAPGYKRDNGKWSGFDNWQVHKATRLNVYLWKSWCSNIGLRAYQYPAVDIDIDEPDLLPLVEEIADIAEEILGPAPSRCGQMPKLLLPYRTNEPIKRSRIWFRQPGTEKRHLVELLGAGQQYVVGGTHASGRPYTWDDDPCERGPDGLSLITIERAQRFMQRVRDHLIEMGYELLPEGRVRGTADRELVDQDRLRSDHLELLERLVARFPNDNDTFATRLDYLRLGYGLKAAFQADPERGYAIFEEWALKWPGNASCPQGNTPEGVRSDWERMKPPFEVGEQDVLDKARELGVGGAELDAILWGDVEPEPEPEPAEGGGGGDGTVNGDGGGFGDDDDTAGEGGAADGDDGPESWRKRQILDRTYDLVRAELKEQLPFPLAWYLPGWHASGTAPVLRTFGRFTRATIVVAKQSFGPKHAKLVTELAEMALEVVGDVGTLIDETAAAAALWEFRETAPEAWSALRRTLKEHPTWGKTGRDLDEHISRNAARFGRTAATSPARERTAIYINRAEMNAMLDRIEQVAVEQQLDLYAQGGRLVRPGWVKIAGREGKLLTVLGMYAQNEAGVALALDEVCLFKSYSQKADEWVPTGCPAEIARKLMARHGRWRLMPLNGTTQIPVIRHDGTVLDKPGYDPATGLFFDPCGLEFGTIRLEPSEGDAREALELLKRELLCGFPFVTETDRAAALSGLMTAVQRRSMAVAPMHLFDAPAAGTGKSYLTDCIATVVIGSDAHVLAQGATDEEMEKRLVGSLIDGRDLIVVDNCSRALGGDLLNQAASQAMLELRPLGQSGKVLVRSTSALLATGNQCGVYGDMVRRTIVSSMDTNMERPEERSFAKDPKAFALKNRETVIRAVLTITLAHRAAGSPVVSNRPMAGFGEYDRMVRQPLLWLGEADPWGSTDALKAEDYVAGMLLRLMAAIQGRLGSKPFTAAQLIRTAEGQEFPDEDATIREAERVLRTALYEVCSTSRGALEPKRLGHYLKKNRRRVVGGFTLAPYGKDGHTEAPLYRVLVGDRDPSA